MGNSSSKAARAAGSAVRKYPQRASAEATQAAKPSNPTASGAAADPAATTLSGQQGPTSHTSVAPSETRNEAIDADARDPGLASRLSELGPVKPYPTYSPSSTTGSAEYANIRSQDTPTRSAAEGPGGGSAGAPATRSDVFPSPASNPAVAMLAARRRIAEEADAEKVSAGREGFEGKAFADIASVRKMLVLRDEQAMPEGEIERAMGLQRGMMGRLGRKGVVEAA